MTAEEAKANQVRIAEHYQLGWYYGTNCTKCCGVYPKFMNTPDMCHCYYECEVCGKRTARYKMPWLAEKAWNNGEFECNQIDIFAFIGGGDK